MSRTNTTRFGVLAILLIGFFFGFVAATSKYQPEKFLRANQTDPLDANEASFNGGSGDANIIPNGIQPNQDIDAKQKYSPVKSRARDSAHVGRDQQEVRAQRKARKVN